MSGEYRGEVSARLPGPDKELTTVLVQRVAGSDLVWLTVAGMTVLLTDTQASELMTHVSRAQRRGS